LRGRRISAPRGLQVRPTTDRVRESMFQIAWTRFGQPKEGAVVLDLFAGSGILGLEALSRGADRSVFVDRSRIALNSVLKNSAILGDEKQIFLILKNISGGERCFRFFCDLKNRFGEFHLIFMDPPYGKGFIEPVCQGICDSGILAPEGVVIAEAGARELLPPSFVSEAVTHSEGDNHMPNRSLCISDERIYGQTRLFFLTRCSGNHRTRLDGKGQRASSTI